jgi:hypothetical protein
MYAIRSALTFEGLTIRDDKVDLSSQLTPETAPTVATTLLGPLARCVIADLSRPHMSTPQN